VGRHRSTISNLLFNARRQQRRVNACTLRRGAWRRCAPPLTLADAYAQVYRGVTNASDIMRKRRLVAGSSYRGPAWRSA